MPTSSRTFRERVLSFGAEADIIAIATEPDAERVSDPPIALPTLIFLNAGVLHRVGPHRLHVSLARSLASVGFTSLRIDLSGIGDSRAVPGTQTFRASAIADTCIAMSHMHKLNGSERFVLIGLCSGADNALATADADPRVVGLVLIDAPAYVTWRARIRNLLQRMRIDGSPMHAARRLRFLLNRCHRVLIRSADATRDANQIAAHDPVPQGRQPPPQDQYGALLKRLLDRGVRILSIYSGALGDRYNHREQIFEVFPALRDRLDVAFFPTANHVFTELAQRRELMTTIGRWCSGWIR